MMYCTLGQFVRDELDNEFYVGVPDDEVEARVAPLILKQTDNTNASLMPPETMKSFFCNGAFVRKEGDLIFNESQIHRAELPAVNGITNAHSLARIYALLIGDVNDNGKKHKRLLSDKTLSEAIKNVTSSNEPDRNWYNKATTFGKGGFQTYGDCFNILGDGVFGHSGFDGSCAFAFLPQQLTYAHVCNYIDPTAFIIDPRRVRLIQTIEKLLHNPTV